MKNIYLKCLRAFIAISLIVIFLISFLRQWTNFPAYKIIYISSDQDALYTSRGLGYYLKWGESFAYFTTLSNIIAISLIFVEWVSFGKIRISKATKQCALLYMSVTGIVFWTSIAPFMPWGQDDYFDFENIHEHLIVFVITIYFYISDKRKINISYSNYGLMLIFPILYLFFTSIIYFATPEHIAIYPFLDFYNWFALDMPKALSIIITLISIILLAFIMIGVFKLLAYLNNRYLKSKESI